MTESHGTNSTSDAQPLASEAQSTTPMPPASAGQSHQPTGHQAPHHQAPIAVEQKSHGLRTFLLAFAGAALACVIGLGGFSMWQASHGGTSSSSGQQTQLGSSESTSVDAQGQDLTLPEAVAKKALPSVAAIDVYTNQSSSSSMFGYNYGYGSSSSGSDTLTQSSLGSGVVLTADGYIATNYHVISSADALKVTVGGDQYDAEVVGSDPSSDLAVIKVQGVSDLTPIEVGNSDDLIIGEWVMTIGSPFGLEQSVATGIVSATSRSQIMSGTSDPYSGTTSETTIYPNMIQTDAAINPGNSGGALVDQDGKLIGINTLITSYSGNYSGVGFAIPVNYAINIAQQIINGETPTHAQLGVSLSTVNAQNAQRYGLPVDSGAYVSRVNEGSGAAEAGLEVGDIITAFDGQSVSSASDLMLDVRTKNPGDSVSLTINRNGQERTVDVTLGSDATTESASTQQQSAQSESSNGGTSSMWERLFGGGTGSQQDTDNAA